MNINLETFWNDNLKIGLLQIPQCNSCNEWNWYPLPTCRHCKGTAFHLKTLSLNGVLYSWTRVHRNFSGLEISEVPYIVGLVCPDDAPNLKIVCRYSKDASTNLNIGLPVVLATMQDAGRVFWGFSEEEL